MHVLPVLLRALGKDENASAERLELFLLNLIILEQAYESSY